MIVVILIQLRNVFNLRIMFTGNCQLTPQSILISKLCSRIKTHCVQKEICKGIGMEMSLGEKDLTEPLLTNMLFVFMFM